MRQRTMLESIFADTCLMRRGRPATKFTRNVVEPAEFDAELFDYEFDHPDRLVEAMTNFFFDRSGTI
jgi:hypothetical protein